MTEVPVLYRRAEELNIPIYHLPLRATGSISIQNPDGSCAIAMDLPSRHTETEQRVRLAHELGHCVTDKWAVETLIPVEALDEAIAAGRTELWDLADCFGVDEAFIKKALSWYVHGNLASELYF